MPDETKEIDDLIYVLGLMTDHIISNNEAVKVCLKYFLENVYIDGYRHRYADIANFLYRRNFEECEGLSHNLYILCSAAEEDPNYSGIHGNLLKLRDHVDLEIARMSFFARNEDKDDSELAALQRREVELRDATNDIKQEIQVAGSSIKDIYSRMDSSTTQSVTILSIFAGIVFVFSGGLTLLGSAVQAVADIKQENIFYLITVLFVAGLILSNLLFLMFYLVLNINKTKISLGCNEECHTCKDQCKNGVGKLRKKYPLLIWTNTVLVACLLVTLAVYILKPIPSNTEVSSPSTQSSLMP